MECYTWVKINYTIDTNMDKSIILNEIAIYNIEWEKTNCKQVKCCLLSKNLTLITI